MGEREKGQLREVEDKESFLKERKMKTTPSYPEKLVKVDDVAAHGRGTLKGGGRGRRRACLLLLSFFFVEVERAG